MPEEPAGYDPFAPGPFTVGARTIHARDTDRDREFPVEIWYPEASPGLHPLILFSHSSGGRRRQSTFLCTHLSSHGYVVAAMDHSETVTPELARREGETGEQKAERMAAMIAARVPDVRFLLRHLLETAAWDGDAKLDADRIGIVGHSFGGWTALAAPDVERRIGAVVALAPGGSTVRKPGILPLALTFAWGRDVPTLYLAGESDISLPLEGIVELFDRTSATKYLYILRRADHLHFMDNVEQQHEAVRAMSFTGELAWIPREMQPIADLCSGQEAHLFIRGLTICHLDAVFRANQEARRLLVGDAVPELAVRGVNSILHRQ
jgi:predicted dienelactone hydrolase